MQEEPIKLKLPKNTAFTDYSDSFEEYYKLCMKDFVYIFNEVERDDLEITRPDLSNREITEQLMKSMVYHMVSEFKRYVRDTDKLQGELFAEWSIRKHIESTEQFDLKMKDLNKL